MAKTQDSSYSVNHRFADRTILTLAIKTASIAIATLILFFNDFKTVFFAAIQSESKSYVLAVPIILLYLLYRKRSVLRAVIPLYNSSQPRLLRHLPSISGMLLVITSILLFFYGSYTLNSLELHLSAVPIFVSGLVLLFFNPQTLRHLLAPIAFLFFLVLPQSGVLNNMNSWLSVLSSQVSRSSFTQTDPTFATFNVSGLLVFMTLIAYTIRDKPWKKAILILIGIPIIFLVNVFRIVILSAISNYYGASLALRISYFIGSWILIFIGTVVFLLIAERILKAQMFAKTEKCPQCNPKPEKSSTFCVRCSRILKPPQIKFRKIDVIKVAALGLLVISLIFAEGQVFALSQRPMLMLLSPQWSQEEAIEILPQMENFTLQPFSFNNTAYETMNRLDRALSFNYFSKDSSNEDVSASIEIASTVSRLRSWEESVSREWEIIQIDLRDVSISGNPAILGHLFAFQINKTKEVQIVLYWFDISTFDINSTMQFKHIEASLVVSMMDSTRALQQLPKIENQLTTMATDIENYWQPIKTWLPVYFVLSRNGMELVSLAGALFLATLFLYGWENRKQKQINRKVYSKLSGPNKQIVDTVRETAKKGIATLDNITDTYSKKTAKTVDKTALLQQLTELENTGVIKRTITNIQDEARQTWRA